MKQDRLIMLPSDEEFNEILKRALPVDFDGSQCVVQRSSGLLETVSFEDAIEYAYGGEYDEVDDDFDKDED